MYHKTLACAAAGSPNSTNCVQKGLPKGLHLIASCENAESQIVRVGPNAAEVSQQAGVPFLSFSLGANVTHETLTFFLTSWCESFGDSFWEPQTNAYVHVLDFFSSQLPPLFLHFSSDGYPPSSRAFSWDKATWYGVAVTP